MPRLRLLSSRRRRRRGALQYNGGQRSAEEVGCLPESEYPVLVGKFVTTPRSGSEAANAEAEYVAEQEAEEEAALQCNGGQHSAAEIGCLPESEYPVMVGKFVTALEECLGLIERNMAEDGQAARLFLHQAEGILEQLEADRRSLVQRADLSGDAADAEAAVAGVAKRIKAAAASLRRLEAGRRDNARGLAARRSHGRSHRAKHTGSE